MGSFRTRVEEGMIGGKRKGVGQETAHVPEDLVRLVAQLEVEPAQLLVVPADDEVVARRVDVHGRDPADAGRQRFEERLLRQVVHPHISLCLMGEDKRRENQIREEWRGQSEWGVRT